MVEYFKKPQQLDNVKVLAVFPASRQDLTISEVLDLFLSTSGDLSLLASSLDKRYQTCKLMSSKDTKLRLAPSEVVN